MRTKQIYNAISASFLFDLVEGTDSDSVWLVESLGGSGLDIRYIPSSDEVCIASSVIIRTPDIINLFVFGRMAEAAAKFGCSISQVKPFMMQASIVTMTRLVHASTFITKEGAEAAMTATDMAADITSKYLIKVSRDCDLDFVDISMFDGIDIESFDAENITQRRYTEFCDWEALIAHTEINVADPGTSVRVVELLRALQRFEIQNPHITLPEVIRHLVPFVRKHIESPAPKPSEIN